MADEQSDAQEQVEQKPPRRKRRRLVIVCGTVALLLAAVGLWWWATAGRSELEELLQSYRDAGQPVDLEDFDPPPAADENNAALALREAAEHLVLNDEEIELLEMVSCKTVADNREQFAAIVKANAKSLQLARKARSMTGADWGVRLRSPVMNTLNSMLNDFLPQRQLIKLLGSTTIYYHIIERDGQAVETLHDALAAAETMREMPFLLGLLLARAEEFLVYETIEAVSFDLAVAEAGPSQSSDPNRVAREQVESLISKLLDTERIRQKARWAVHAERAFSIDLVRQSPAEAIDAWAGIKQPSAWSEAKALAMKPFIRKDLVRTTRDLTACAEAASQTTWPDATKLLPPTVTLSQWQRFFRPLSGGKFLYNNALPLSFRARAHRTMAAIALAIRLYEIDHGRRPTKLDELVPAYLPAVPDDPFAAPGQAIGYLPDIEHPRLYSIGDDGIDNAGKDLLDIKKIGVYAGGPDQCFYLNGRPPDPDDEAASGPTSRGARRSRGWRRRRKSELTTRDVPEVNDRTPEDE